MITHHPPDELLLDCATGTQARALSLAVAGHLDFCLSCRTNVRLLEVLGGQMIEDLEPAGLDAGALEACLSRLDEPMIEGRPAPARTTSPVPAVLQPLLGTRLADLAWRSVGGLFDEVKLPSISAGYRTSVLRVAPGGHVPEHGHEGNEFMLVLQGAYKSGGRHYTVGDFSACDGSEEHSPVADEGEDCICLLVLDGPLAFRDAEGRRIAPLLHI